MTAAVSTAVEGARARGHARSDPFGSHEFQHIQDTTELAKRSSSYEAEDDTSVYTAVPGPSEIETSENRPSEIETSENQRALAQFFGQSSTAPAAKYGLHQAGSVHDHMDGHTEIQTYRNAARESEDRKSVLRTSGNTDTAG